MNSVNLKLVYTFENAKYEIFSTMSTVVMYGGKRRICHLHKIKINHSYSSVLLSLFNNIFFVLFFYSIFHSIRIGFVCNLSAAAVFRPFRLIKTAKDAKKKPGTRLVSDKVAHSNSNI